MEPVDPKNPPTESLSTDLPTTSSENLALSKKMNQVPIDFRSLNKINLKETLETKRNILEGDRIDLIKARLSKDFYLENSLENESIEQFIERCECNYKNSILSLKDSLIEFLKEESKSEEEINDFIFNELVVKESEEYLKALKEIKGETVLNKGLEKAKELLNTKAMQWYMGLSVNQKRAVSFGIGSVVGLAAGAAGSIGVTSYLGWRAARMAVGGMASAWAGERVDKKWTLEEVEANKQKEIEDLKADQRLSLEEKTKGFADIEKRYKKEKLKVNAIRVGARVGAAGVAGLFAGAIEHDFVANGTTKSVVENHNVVKPRSINENKFSPRKPFEPAPIKTAVTGETPSLSKDQLSEIKPVTPEPASAVVQPTETVTKPATPTSQMTVTEKLFVKPEILVHEVKAGDSAWKILQDTLKQGEKFKELSEAQKTYVLSALTNKVLKNPGDYGIGEDGVLKIGTKTDFTKLFEDEKELGKIFDKARGLTKSQAENILQNNKKIETWVKQNPDELLTKEKVSEILNQEIEVEPEPDPVVDGSSEVIIKNNEVKPINPEPAEVEEGLNEGNTMLAGGVGMATIASARVLESDHVGKDKTEEENQKGKLVEDINEAKKRLGILENQKNQNIGAVNSIRSMSSDSREMVRRAVSNDEVEKHLSADLDNIYGKKGFLGIGKVAGMNTKEWKEVALINAQKFLAYYTNPEDSDLPKKVLESLLVSEAHRNLVGYIDFLKSQAGEDVIPYESETIVNYLKRLGKFVAEHSEVANTGAGVELKKAA
jgi:hypothetical protein